MPRPFFLKMRPLSVGFAAVVAFLTASAVAANRHNDSDERSRNQEAPEGSARLRATPYAVTRYGADVVAGEAELRPQRHGRLEVEARLEGLTPGTAHIGHIHLGDCGRLFPGTIIHDLSVIWIGEDGSGASTTVLEDSLIGLKDCEWWVAFHEGPANTSPQTPAVAVGPVLIEREQ